MPELKWWQKAVFYQIYPRSFADGCGDGIGDFKGMLEKLPYLHDLGVGALWLSPHFPSPNRDCGYDISDYQAVAPEYGSLSDFRNFLDAAHRLELRVILDLVLNHTSDQHAWFLESRSSRDNPKRDWYVWRDPKPDGIANGVRTPNNWLSTFDGPAWELDERTGQYYYHFFLREQPDLNWRNPQVKDAMFNAARFWLDMGVDGFRLDAIGTIYEEPGFPDHPYNLSYLDLRRLVRSAHTPDEQEQAWRVWEGIFEHQLEQPGTHALMQELRAVMDEYGPGERVLVGENDQIAYHGSGLNELHMVFNFPLMRADRLTPAHIRTNQHIRLAGLAAVSPDAWPCNTLGNHDTPRLYSRFGATVPGADTQLARLHGALLLTLKGTPFLYYGDEIGMTDLELSDISQFRDTMATWLYHSEIEQFGVNPVEALQNACKFTRDQGRSPMQWTNAPNAGFCPPDVHPWLPVNPNYAEGVNVAEQIPDYDSLLNFYRDLLRLRRQTPALVEGDYQELDAGAEACLTFLRSTAQQTCLVALNFSDKLLVLDTLELDGVPAHGAAFVLYPDRRIIRNTEKMDLPPWGVIIVELIEQTSAS